MMHGRRRVDRQPQLLLLLLRRDLEVVQQIADECAGVAAGRFGQLLAGIEPREPQQVLDQALHARGVAVDDVEEAALASSCSSTSSISASA